MPVDAATTGEETDLNFQVNLPLLREDIPHGVFASVSTYLPTYLPTYLLIYYSFLSLCSSVLLVQCDQMANLLVQYLAICNTEHLSKTI